MGIHHNIAIARYAEGFTGEVFCPRGGLFQVLAGNQFCFDVFFVKAQNEHGACNAKGDLVSVFDTIRLWYSSNAVRHYIIFIVHCCIIFQV